MRKMLFVTAFVVVAFALPAAACEICEDRPAPDLYMCSSGHESGKQWCYGGFGFYCTMGGKCPSVGFSAADGSQLSVTDFTPVLSSASTEDAAPREGFVLDVAAEPEPAAGR